MGFVSQREIKILGEAVRFEITLLETGSAFEYPLVRERRMVEDAGKEPPEHVVISQIPGDKGLAQSCRQRLHCQGSTKSTLIRV